jgi:glycerophosphoryl diester phosphodiesterase
VNLRRRDEPPIVVGHRGAAAIAPENTRAALQVAVDVGAHFVEFDIGPDLQLAHSRREVPEDALSLDEALAFLADHEIGVHLDVKLPGYEQDIVDAVDRHALRDRTILSTAFAGSSRRLAVIAPSVPRAIGYPRDSLGVARFAWPAGLTRAGAAALRQAMPARVPLLIRVARATVLSLHHTLCSRTAVRVAHSMDVPVLGWTANDPASVRRLALLGVDGIVSDDPQMALKTLATLPGP